MPRIEPIPMDRLSEESRAAYEAGAKAGAFTDPIPYQILAYAHHAAPPADGDRHPNYPASLLPGSLLERLHADHHGIDDDFYRRLAAQFTTAEIIELGQICGSTMGMHRFLHTLRFYSDEPPVIPYDPAQVGVTRAQREAAG
ncbi:hypothetical protein ACFOD9_01120 [Novosphingobium bradum]|uniref:Uncharacterized protein n=1 Tax=Novosphingobium bradum TaxID=1737444 RepID=A0ABV7IJI1_9SPHN